MRSTIAIGPPDTGASALTFTPDGFAYSYAQPGGMVIQHQRSDGQLDWARSWTGDFTIYAMASDAAGDVVFTGQYFADIDFQPGVVEDHPSGEVANNTYVTLLGPDATTVFAANAGESYVRGVATNGNVVAVSGEHDVGPRVPHLFRFDRTGRMLGDLENAGLRRSRPRRSHVARRLWTRLLEPQQRVPALPAMAVLRRAAGALTQLRR